MFEYAESDPVLSDEEFARQEHQLRTDLVLQQYELLQRADRTILVIVAGFDGAGKGSTINLLNEWMDPRHLRTLAFGVPTAEERARPPLWRYWKSLPAKGHIGLLFGSWYERLLRLAYSQTLGDDELDLQAQHLQRFEAMLAAEGVTVLKLWYHLSREAQQHRCDMLSADPDTAWRVSRADRAVVQHFPVMRQGAERVLRATEHAAAPWHIVPSASANQRIVTTAQLMLQALGAPTSDPPAVPVPAPARNAFAALDYSQKIDKSSYEATLQHWQGRLSRAVRNPGFQERSLVLVFEGDDAAGKGGAIRRITAALDMRQYHIMPVSAPSDEERARPYLWRFWREIPAHGKIAIFDRSWYGRVLVERVEKLIPEAVWARAYNEIADFEQELAEHGAIILKFWLSISPEEQLKRFKARRQSPFKSFKLTPDDWRNRKRRPQYLAAASSAFELTHTHMAPWHLIASNDKKLARLRVLQAIVNALENQLQSSAGAFSPG